MDFDNVVIKDSPGLCRCCLSEGCYKDLGSEYIWMGEPEIYAEMLLECFDINISQHNNGPNGPNRLICEVCITRLRDACNFKKQVMDSERKFVDMLARGDFIAKVSNNAPMKAETSEAEAIEEDHIEVEYLENDMEYDYEDIKEEDSDGEIKEKPARASATSTRKAREEPKRKKTQTESKQRVRKTTKKGRKQLQKEEHRDDANIKNTISTTKRNRLMKKNAILVLESSTVCPFKWQRQNYLCFFCHRTFKHPDPLKEHTKCAHELSSIKSAVSYLRRDEKVKIDVSVISCRICESNIEDLLSLKNHLKNVHKKFFLEKYGDGLIPYRLQNDNFQCAVCNRRFQYFIKLNQHMNEHFGNYVCEACGKGFLSQDRLRSHSLSHGSSFRCTECPENFGTLTQKNNHVAHVHNKVKNLKCCYCSETFTNYVQRKKHHKSMHNIDMPEYNCPVCGKVFQIMSKMQVHVKEVHVREKNHSCTVCEQKFFSKNHVQKHMIKHYGERIHQCEVCKKSYARKQTLRDHMRIHNNDRRFVCDVCSQAFVQNNSLRLHMRVHHPDVLTG